MRVALLAYGTRGDIQPTLVVGEELLRRGHAVTITVNPNLAGWARRSRLEVVEMPPDLEVYLKSADGQRMLALGKAAAVSREMARLDREASAAVTAALLRASEGADLLVSTIMTYHHAVEIAAARRARHVALATFPVLPTRRWTHILWPHRDLRVGALNRWSHAVVNRIWWRDRHAEIAHTARAAGGAPPTRMPELGAEPVVNIFSAHVAPRPDDWPARFALTGFVTPSTDLRARLGEGGVPPALDRWLAAGEPPVFFGFGSMPVLDPTALLERVIEVTRRRGLRALIGAGWTDYGAARGGLPDHVFVAPAFDHDRVLPRCRAAVHHGGAGTTAAALRAGLPTLIAAVFGDQPFWAWRIAALGVGVGMRFRDFTAARLEAALDRLLAPEVAARARALGERLRAEDGVTAAGDAIEAAAR